MKEFDLSEEEHILVLKSGFSEECYFKRDVKEFISKVEIIIIKRESRREQLIELRELSGEKLI